MGDREVFERQSALALSREWGGNFFSGDGASGEGARRRMALDNPPEERARSHCRGPQLNEERAREPRILARPARARPRVDDRSMRRGDGFLVRGAEISCAARAQGGGERGVPADFGTTRDARDRADGAGLRLRAAPVGALGNHGGRVASAEGADAEGRNTGPASIGSAELSQTKAEVA